MVGWFVVFIAPAVWACKRCSVVLVGTTQRLSTEFTRIGKVKQQQGPSNTSCLCARSSPAWAGKRTPHEGSEFHGLRPRRNPRSKLQPACDPGQKSLTIPPGTVTACVESGTIRSHLLVEECQSHNPGRCSICSWDLCECKKCRVCFMLPLSHAASLVLLMLL